MAITLTADGLLFDEGTEMKNRVFRDEDKTDSSYTYTTSWSNGWTTKNFSIPAKSKVLMRYNIPCRNDDTASWGGGHYSKVYYSINDAAWVDLGNSGYTSCMHTSCGSITRYACWHHFDFNSITSDFTLKFLFSHVSYTGTGNINGNAIAGGANQVYHGSNTTPFRHHVTIEGFTTA
jgi:hypothetical protein